MFDYEMTTRVNRRGFLKGSALFAATVAVAYALPAHAQEPQQQPAPEAPEKKDEAPKKKPLLDKDGREYRVCDMCGGNMYKQEKTWTCEQCGFSFEE
jgi:anaerobic selenocysteine-containing dehydrogenase